MAEKVVSVKMPSSLVSELDALRSQDHYLDFSEQLRSIVRTKALALQNPYTQEIRRISHDLKQASRNKTAREQVISDILGMLKEEPQ